MADDINTLPDASETVQPGQQGLSEQFRRVAKIGNAVKALVTGNGPLTEQALSATIAGTVDERATLLSGVLELQPLWVSGHSWQAVDTNATPGTRWYERLKSRFRMGTATNKAVSGRTIGDISNLTLAGGNAWTPRTKALVGLMCTINDVTIFDGSAASLRGYRHAWRSMLSQITANAAVASNTASFVYSPGWSSETAAGTPGSPQGATPNSTGGTRFKTTTVGSYFEFSFTGAECDVFLVARATGAGVVEFREGATVLGTLDLTAATAQDCAAIFRVRGRGTGTHTIRGTLTGGASVTVDSYRIPLAAPVPIIVCGEPEVGPAPADHGTYWADVQAFKADLAAVCAEFPSVIYVDLDQPDWDPATMLVTDSNGGRKHPNDKGCAYIATKVTQALLDDLDYLAGLNVTTSASSYPDAYVVPAGPPVPAGGSDGTGSTTPTPAIPTGYASRYRASSLTGTSGDVVSTLTDEGSAAVNLTGTNGPTLRTSPFKYLEFDGVNDAMSRAAAAPTPSSYLVVGRIRTLAPGATQVMVTGGTNSAHVLGKASTSGNWIVNNGAVLDTGRTATEGDWVVFGYTFNGASSIITFDGEPALTGDTGTNVPSAVMYVGRSSGSGVYYAVDVAEIILYTSALSAASLQAGALKLMSDYGL